MPHSGECSSLSDSASRSEAEEPEPEVVPEPDEQPEAEEPSVEELEKEFQEMLGIDPASVEKSKDEQPRAKKGAPIKRQEYPGNFELFWEACHPKARKCGKKGALRLGKRQRSKLAGPVLKP